MYCADHDTVGCHVCFTIHHKSCQGIHYIPEYIQKNNQTENVRIIKVNLERAMSEMNLVLKRKQEAIKENKKNKVLFLEEIQNFRKEINEVLDGLEQAGVAELNSTFERLDEEYNGDLRLIKDKIEKLTSRKTEIETSQRNPSQLFVNVKMSEKILTETEKDEARMLASEGKCFTFQTNCDVLHFLKNIDKLVYFPSPRLYEVSNKNTYNVKMTDDKSSCDIRSSCVLDSGDILLADYGNQSIKLVDNGTYSIKDSLQMPAIPRSVCKVSDTEAAVSLANKTVQFVSTKNHLTKTRVLTFFHDCRGIAVLDGQLVMGVNRDKVYMYTMKGDRLKVIEKDKKDNKLFQIVRELCVSDNSKLIHIADGNKGVITIDRDGNVIWKYVSNDLKDAWGVCTDGTGSVFVSGWSSKNVVQLRPDGKLFGQIVSKQHNKKYPQAVCFDRKQRKLIVGDANEIYVFKLR